MGQWAVELRWWCSETLRVNGDVPGAHKQVSPGLAYVVPEAGEDDAVVASDEDDVDGAAEDAELVEGGAVVVVTGLVVLEPVDDGTVELVVADGKLVLVELGRGARRARGERRSSAGGTGACW